jgi:hypothetical protein
MEEKKKQTLVAALVQAALVYSREISVHMAEIIAYLQKQEHLAAVGTLEIVEEPFESLRTMLKAAARLTH